MKILLPFFKWIFKQASKGIADKNEVFRDCLQYRPWEGIFVWILVSVLSSMAVLLLLGGIQFAIGIDVPIQLWFAYILSCFAYMIYTSFSLMYNAFKADRAELFETIKNGK